MHLLLTLYLKVVRVQRQWRIRKAATIPRAAIQAAIQVEDLQAEVDTQAADQGVAAPQVAVAAVATLAVAPQAEVHLVAALQVEAEAS